MENPVHEDVIEGGVAEIQQSEPRTAIMADITLYVQCTEDIVPGHPILSKDKVVQIGVDKNTKIAAVFKRYWIVAKEKAPLDEEQMNQEDLEFLHVQILTGQETPEVAALMKNDTIKVQKQQGRQRQYDMEFNRVQRELDRDFFAQMNFHDGDTVLDCQGKQQEDDKVQQFLSTHVKCHAPIVTKRCPWLGDRIRNATKIITLDHPPHAVSLLLEYCYTNRVICLGYEAFMQTCRTKPEPKKAVGPVPPFSQQRKWPLKGHPCVSFAQAKAALCLAEEARMVRLSLMCEVAAAQLVDPTNVIDALILCQTQKDASGNALPILRKAAMLILFNNFALLKDKIKENEEVLASTLLIGTTEVMDPKKEPDEDWRTSAYQTFKEYDEEDKMLRRNERLRRRRERTGRRESGQKRDSDTFDPANEYDVRPLKKMRGHDIRWVLK